MVRRASSKPKPLWFITTLLLLAAALGGGYWLYQEVQDPYRVVQDLNIDIYMENANSLRGNVYKIEGTVENSLAWSPVKGRLFSFETGSSSQPGYVAVLVPPQLNHINIQKGQRFRIKVEVIQDGILQVVDMRKS